MTSLHIHLLGDFHVEYVSSQYFGAKETEFFVSPLRGSQIFVKTRFLPRFIEKILEYDGEPVTAVDSTRLQSLLAYLLLHSHAPQPRQGPRVGARFHILLR